MRQQRQQWQQAAPGIQPLTSIDLELGRNLLKLLLLGVELRLGLLGEAAGQEGEMQFKAASWLEGALPCEGQVLG